MKTVLLFVTALVSIAAHAQSGPSADFVPPTAAYYFTGTGYSPFTVTGTGGAAQDNLPAVGIWGYNSTTKKWYPCSATNPCTGAGAGGAPTGAASGDLSGSYPSPTVATVSGGPAAAPTGTCSTAGQWVFSKDGHATFCPSAGGVWTTKI